MDILTGNIIKKDLVTAQLIELRIKLFQSILQVHKKSFDTDRGITDQKANFIIVQRTEKA